MPATGLLQAPLRSLLAPVARTQRGHPPGASKGAAALLARAAAPRRRPTMHVRADLWGTVDQVVTVGALAVGVGATLLAILADRRPAAQVKEEQEVGFKWGLSGGLACLPLFNWMVSAGSLAGGGVCLPSCM